MTSEPTMIPSAQNGIDPAIIAMLTATIWPGSSGIFPAATPVEHLDYAKLARLNMSGGNIRSIALNAAFLAADEGAAVGMKHLLQAAHTEAAKRERPLSDAETRGWIWSG